MYDKLVATNVDIIIEYVPLPGLKAVLWRDKGREHVNYVFVWLYLRQFLTGFVVYHASFKCTFEKFFPMDWLLLIIL